MKTIAGLTLDSGALIALERGAGRVRALLDRAAQNAWPVVVPSGALAQTWRGGPRQTRVARLLAQPEVTVSALDEATARAVGMLCGRSGCSDVVDVQVALHATEQGHHVVTSDPDDLRAINPVLPLVVV